MRVKSCALFAGYISLTPLERYQQDLKREDFTADQAQLQAVNRLQRVYDDLMTRHKRNERGSNFLRRMSFRNSEPVQGLYMWGGVGRGKTYLMDVFYDSLPFDNKIRTHFHRFMRDVHHELTALSGEKNPLKLVAANIAKKAQVICFDEFFVSDISDAMILAGLFEELFRREIVLIATSNIEPDGLYKDGLQRARFLPAIAMLKQRSEVLNVDGGTDYRLRALEQAELYHSPLDDTAHESLAASFLSLAPDEIEYDTKIEIEGRYIDVHALGDDIVWFEFEAICDGPRSQHDYIEIAKEYHAVLVANVPVFTSKDDQARRFINLVDEFYDRRVKLIVSAAAGIDSLYEKGRLSFEFERTQSRLLEMQSKDYLEQAHLA